MKKLIRFFAVLVISTVLVILIAHTAIGQDEEMTLQEFVNHVIELLRELQETVDLIAETAADKTEVRALETRVAALETAMPWPTATPTATPTPTPFPDEASNFALQLAIDDHDGGFRDFFDYSEDEQDRIFEIFLDYFLKTVEVCKLTPDRTFALLQKYAEPRDWYSPPALEARLRYMEMGGAGWRFDFIERIATNSIVQGVIRDYGGCDSYLEWYTGG